MRILVLNSGSSSQKGRLYEILGTPPPRPPAALWGAKIEWEYGPGHRQALERMLREVPSPERVDVVGHRVVHGGAAYDEPIVITPEVKATLARLSDFAPLHNRAAIEEIEVVEQVLGRVPQVAVFDTAFHRHLPLAAAVYPGPYEWFTQGIRRYGFHGINHGYCAGRAAALLGRELHLLRLITCHLGNGCSLAAIREGHSIDTTMGFTPLEGLMMGTRSGSVDPGILTYVLRRFALSPEQLDDVLNTRSGLLGISGLSGDMRKILTALQAGNARAKLAFEIYVHRLQAGIAAMVAALGGIDALVFTAGVGEHSPEVRAAACANLGFLGLHLDAGKNAQSTPDGEISRPDSNVRVLIVAAEEDWMIARACWRLAARRRQPPGNPI